MIPEKFQPLSTVSIDIHDRIVEGVLRGTYNSIPKHNKQKHAQPVCG